MQISNHQTFFTQITTHQDFFLSILLPINYIINVKTGSAVHQVLNITAISGNNALVPITNHKTKQNKKVDHKSPDLPPPQSLTHMNEYHTSLVYWPVFTWGVDNNGNCGLLPPVGWTYIPSGIEEMPPAEGCKGIKRMLVKYLKWVRSTFCYSTFAFTWINALFAFCILAIFLQVPTFITFKWYST